MAGNNSIPFSIRSFDITEPIEDKNTKQWKVAAAVKVLHKKTSAPDPSLEVILTVIGGESHRLMTDRETGEVTQELVFDKKGSYLVQVALAEYPGVMMTRRVTIKAEDKKKVPGPISVGTIGPLGKQSLFISVGTDDGQLIPNFTGAIINGTKKDTFTTGKDGTCLYPVNLERNETSRVVRVRIGNRPDQSREFVIEAPKRTAAPTQPNPLTQDLGRRIH